MSLADRLIKKSKVRSSTFDKAEIHNRGHVDVGVPIINAANSGMLNTGYSSGFTMIAGPSKHFKSNLTLALAKAYLKKYDDAIVIFYDSEFGATKGYFESFGIDMTRVIHKEIRNIEELKHDIVPMLEEDITKDDHVFIMIDSIGNLASKKEIDDAVEGKSVQDMTRAKQMKSVFRMITPYLKTNDIPMVGINHTYDEIGGVGAPKKIVSGGQGAYYSADTIFVVGRRQIKEGKEITGWTFVLNVEKSRFVKEKAAIPFDVMFDGGISKYSGLLDVALITGHVETPKKGWYTRPSIEEDKNWRRKESNCDEFWEPILADESFHEAVKKLYSLDSGKMFSEDLIEALGATVEEIDYDTGEILTD